MLAHNLTWHLCSNTQKRRGQHVADLTITEVCRLAGIESLYASSRAGAATEQEQRLHDQSKASGSSTTRCIKASASCAAGATGLGLVVQSLPLLVLLMLLA